VVSKQKNPVVGSSQPKPSREKLYLRKMVETPTANSLDFTRKNMMLCTATLFVPLVTWISPSLIL